MASTYLYRTPSSAGNRRTYTVSFWVKRSDNAQFTYCLDCSISGGENPISFFDNSFVFSAWNSSDIFRVVSSAVYRDTSAWYHCVVAVDTTQATASNRVKLYINGEQITSFSTSNYPSQNYETYINSTNEHSIGRWIAGNSRYLNGYLAHYHFCDGTQYAASDFGETDTNGQWKPNPAPSVTYGTNGFFLKFADSGSLGTDSSGNGNNFTVSGSGDQVTDTPDNVFCTLNSVDKDGHTNADGNLKVSGDVVYGMQRGTQGPSSGKWYFEALLQTAQNDTAIGLANENENIYTRFTGETTNSVGYLADGRFFYNSSATTYSSLTTGDIFQIAFDADTGKIWIGKNNTWQNSGDPAAGTNAVQTVTWNNFIPAARTVTTGVLIYNFGQDSSFTANKTAQNNADDNGYGDFYYSPPTGFLALCTKNLSSELTLPIGDGSQYLNTVLYTGTGATRSVTGVGFQPDLVWIKARSFAEEHMWYDSTRGATKDLRSSSSNAENTNATGLTLFDSDGFSTGSMQNVNNNTSNYVAWNWLANGGTTSSNTDGSITSTVQANTTAGFSIVTYSGSNSNSTIGHGLNSAPELVIIKNLTLAVNWKSYHKPLGNTYTLSINGTGAATVQNLWQNTTPTNSVVYLTGNIDNSNQSGSNYVAYCFHSVEGYSKFGSYEGNGSNDGPFVYTGFRPAFILYKNADRGLGGAGWFLWDTTRDTRNPTDLYLVASNSNAEGSFDSLDILSNGFKIRTNDGGQNGSSETVIYMAFAENPFVDSTGRPVTAR